MDLSLIPWGTLGPAGLLAVVVGLVFMGQLQPKLLVDRDIRLLEQQAAHHREEAKSWRTAWELSERARGEQGQQLGTLLETTRTTEELVRAFRAASTS